MNANELREAGFDGEAVATQANSITIVQRPFIRPIAALTVGLAIAAMAVDHLLGSDPGLEDPPTFLIASALTLALAALVFGRIVPNAIDAGRETRDGLVLSAVAVVPGIATLWLGLPFVLGGGAIALGLAARQRHASRRALITVALGALILSFGIGAYLVQFVDKLG
jgi:hypothetical protein